MAGGRLPLSTRMKHVMKLNATPFAMIKSGQKWVEMRLYDEKRRQINVGDELEFTHTETAEKLHCLVKGLRICATFEQLYRHYDKLALGYRADEIADPKDMLAYYSWEKIADFGVVGIEVELVP